jgi:hypothetical protein
MQWVAPSAKDSATDTLEKRLWDAADQLRANSGLSPQQDSGPVLEKQAAGGRRGSPLRASLLENDFHSFARELRTGEAPLT